MVETSDGVLSVSFRSRTGFDVSKIANEVGGGGHKAAAGARIEGLPFQEAVNKVLKAARKYAAKV
jgi:phosphoesterase RecJ-like protein